MPFLQYRPSNFPLPTPTTSFWQSSHPDPLPRTLSSSPIPTSASIVIIGSGITAALAAWHLAQSGQRDILLLEAREACSGATGRNGGHCHPIIYGNEIADFELANFGAIADLIYEHDIPCEYRQLKSVHAFYSSSSFATAKKQVLETMATSPAHSKLLSVVEDAQTLTSLHIPSALGAIIQGVAGTISPYKFVTWLLSTLLQRSQIDLRTQAPVTSLTPAATGSWSVQTPRGTIQAQTVLVATNGYTSALLPQFADLISPCQNNCVALTDPARIAREYPTSRLEHSYAFCGTRNPLSVDYLIQRPHGGEMIFGGGRSFTPNKGMGSIADDKVDADTIAYLRGALGKHMELGTDALKTEAEWSGIVGRSRDGAPWVGAVPGMEGVWVCGGYDGHGMSLAPLSATHVVALMLASRHGRNDWREVERKAVERGDVPATYVCSEERMKRVGGLKAL